jgi:glycosyltransferase involved in cell wall biosynthesis
MGGAERLVETAIPYFDRDRFDYEVAYCLPRKNDVIPALEKAGIPVFCLNFRTDYDVRAMYRLLRLLRERNPRILHLHLPYTGILGRVIGRLAGVEAIVYTEHNVMEKYRPLTRWLNQFTYPMNAKIIAVSGEVDRSITRHLIARSTDHTIIRNGIALNHRDQISDPPDEIKRSLGIPAGHQVVGNVAHIRPEKGHEYLLRTAALVLARRPAVSFVIVGREKEGGEIQRLEELAGTLGIRNNVIFTGFRQDVPRLVSIFDVFVLSSLFEGLPLALLEAMVMGKPAVATSVGGIPEVIQDGVNGFLVPPGNPEALAEKTIRLLEDEALRKDISRRAALTVRDGFDIGSMVKKVEQVYNEVLDHRR